MGKIEEVWALDFHALIDKITDKYDLSIGEAISASIPEKRSLAMAQDDELKLWLEYYLTNGRRLEL